MARVGGFGSFRGCAIDLQFCWAFHKTKDAASFKLCVTRVKLLDEAVCSLPGLGTRYSAVRPFFPAPEVHHRRALLDASLGTLRELVKLVESEAFGQAAKAHHERYGIRAGHE